MNWNMFMCSCDSLMRERKENVIKSEANRENKNEIYLSQGEEEAWKVRDDQERETRG